MTEYFEILDRDGAARIGEVRVTSPRITPALADDFVVNAGSEWAHERSLPDSNEDVVTLLPHRGLPPGTPDEVAAAFTEDPPTVDGPSGVVVDSRTATDQGADVYALSTVQGIVGHATAFREAIIKVREAIPADTALYLSGVATPANVSLLAYVGVDLVDSDRARVAATQGRYLTTTGAVDIDDLTELPCACPACGVSLEAFDREACMAHNVGILRSELANVREHIRRGRIREHVSSRCRHVPWLTAALREFDQEQSYLERRAPIYRHSRMDATSEDDLHRPEIERFADRVTDRYTNRFDVPLVLLPCSAKKPYRESQSHRKFREAIAYRAHRVSLSSPLGVVPQELECTYPAQHYDVPVTGRWTETERAVVGSVLTTYLARNDGYPRVIAHVPPGPYRALVEQASRKTGIDVTYTVSDHPTTSNSLSALEDALADSPTYARRERREHTVRALADYQFGAGAGDAIFDTISVRSPYPKHRVHAADETHLATMVPEYGLLAMTLAGARRWVESDVPTKTVSIDPFVPHGDVLAPGITGADPTIRVGEEVIVDGPRAFAVGRAMMDGQSMVESTRGVAVDVRHTEERSAGDSTDE